MIKSSILLIVLSVLAVLFRNQLVYVLHWLLWLDNKIVELLSMIFSHDSIGALINNVLALIILPVLFGIVTALICLLIKRSSKCYVISVVWIVWIILLVTILVRI